MPGSILIIDRSVERAARLDATLQECGFLTSVVLSGRTARPYVAQNAPDAMLIRTELADGCGFELAYDVNRHPHLEFTPVFLFSHRACEDDFARSFASGAIALLSLPQDMPDLLLRLPALIRTKRLAEELEFQHPVQPGFGLAEAPATFDREERTIRVRIDPDVYGDFSKLAAFDAVESAEDHDCRFMASFERSCRGLHGQGCSTAGTGGLDRGSYKPVRG